MQSNERYEYINKCFCSYLPYWLLWVDFVTKIDVLSAIIWYWSSTRLLYYHFTSDKITYYHVQPAKNIIFVNTHVISMGKMFKLTLLKLSYRACFYVKLLFVQKFPYERLSLFERINTAKLHQLLNFPGFNQIIWF